MAVVNRNGLFLVLMLFCSIGNASNHCDTLRVASAHDWYPIAFKANESNAQIHGIAIKLVQTIAKEHDVKVELLGSLPWKRALMWMDAGKVDVLAGHYLSSKRKKNWQVSSPWFYDDIRIFYHKDLSSDINPSSIAHYRGAYPAGASYGDEVDELIQNELMAVPFRDNRLLFNALMKGRVDYIITAKEDGLAHMNKLEMEDRMEMSSFSLAEPSIHLSFSKKSSCAYLFDKFNKSIIEHVAKGSPQSWLEKSNVYFDLKP